jgi:ParB/RepB/Spo0J family partition protein
MTATTPAESTAVAAAEPRLVTLAIDSIAPSSTTSQRRRRDAFDQDALLELARNIAAVGVLQPILVRPVPAGTIARAGPMGPPCDYELVAGERRLRASAIARCKTIPALVRALSDAQVLEIQLIENLQREGLHPLDEAEGYRALLDAHAYTVDALAEKIGKSREYIFARMKLLALTDDVRDTFRAGRLSMSNALLIARLPPLVQTAAADEIRAGRRTQYGDRIADQEVAHREAMDLVHRDYALKLPTRTKPEPFDPTQGYTITLHGFDLKAGTRTRTDVTVGPCADCRKNTHGQADLFHPATGPNHCLDKSCFHGKAAAAEAARIARWRDDGGRVVEIDGPMGRQGIGNWVEPTVKEFDLDGYKHTYQHYLKQLGSAAPKPALIVRQEETHVDGEHAALKHIADDLPAAEGKNEQEWEREQRLEELLHDRFGPPPTAPVGRLRYEKSKIHAALKKAKLAKWADPASGADADGKAGSKASGETDVQRKAREKEELNQAGQRAVWTALSQAMRERIGSSPPERSGAFQWHEAALRKILTSEIVRSVDNAEISEPLEWLIADRYVATDKKPLHASMMTLTDITLLTGPELTPTATDLLVLTWQLGTISQPPRQWDHDPWPAIVAEARKCGLDPDAIHAHSAAVALAARKEREAQAAAAAAAAEKKAGSAAKDKDKGGAAKKKATKAAA